MGACISTLRSILSAMRRPQQPPMILALAEWILVVCACIYAYREWQVRRQRLLDEWVESVREPAGEKKKKKNKTKKPKKRPKNTTAIILGKGSGGAVRGNRGAVDKIAPASKDERRSGSSRLTFPAYETQRQAIPDDDDGWIEYVTPSQKKAQRRAAASQKRQISVTLGSPVLEAPTLEVQRRRPRVPTTPKRGSSSVNQPAPKFPEPLRVLESPPSGSSPGSAQDKVLWETGPVVWAKFRQAPRAVGSTRKAAEVSSTLRDRAISAPSILPEGVPAMKREDAISPLSLARDTFEGEEAPKEPSSPASDDQTILKSNIDHVQMPIEQFQTEQSVETESSKRKDSGSEVSAQPNQSSTSSPSRNPLGRDGRRSRDWSAQETERKAILRGLELGHKLIAIDLEHYQSSPEAVAQLTEVGIAFLDSTHVPRELLGGLNGTTFNAAEIIKRMHFKHFRVAGSCNVMPEIRREMQCAHLDEGCRNCFCLGRSEEVSLSRAHLELDRALEYKGMSSPEVKPNWLFIAHAAENECRDLKKADFNIRSRFNLVDTQVAAGPYLWGDEEHLVTLRDLLAGCGIKGEHLHNAGNDAAYTLMAAVCMADPAYDTQIDPAGICVEAQALREAILSHSNESRQTFRGY